MEPINKDERNIENDRFTLDISMCSQYIADLRCVLSNEISYKMDHGRRGIAVIFNQKHFYNRILVRRTGTKRDARNLINTLKSLGFDIWTHIDASYDTVVKTLKRVANMDHSKHDCLIIVVLTYGKHDYLYACDTCYKVDFLCNHFIAENCPTLARKPKLFFIHACQCDEYNAKLTEYIPNELSEAFRIQADFLIVYSTIPVHRSQNDIRGTWFIEALCSQLRENGTRYDLLTLLTFVCQRVTENFNETVPQLTVEQKKQIPCIISMLTRLVKFIPNN